MSESALTEYLLPVVINALLLSALNALTSLDGKRDASVLALQLSEVTMDALY